LARPVHTFLCSNVSTMTVCSMFTDRRTTRQRTGLTAASLPL